MTDSESTADTLLYYTSDSDVLPYCVYYSINHDESTYRAYVSGPSITKVDNQIRYQCLPPKSLDSYGNWTLAFTFYAMNPMIRPIPSGMSLFCAQKNSSYPWDTVSIRVVYDPYDVNNDCVYFIAYNKPVPWTKPLFVHTKGDIDFPVIAFPSWDPNPPGKTTGGKYTTVKSKEILTQPIHKWVGSPTRQANVENVTDLEGTGLVGWKHAAIFPFFVLSPDTFGPHYEKIQFICNNAMCIPYNPKNDYVEKVSVRLNERLEGPKATPRTLTQCTIRCSELVPEELGGGQPYSLPSMIARQLDIISRKSATVSDKIAKVSPVLIAILVMILAIALGVLIYFSIRKK